MPENKNTHEDLKFFNIVYSSFEPPSTSPRSPSSGTAQFVCKTRYRSGAQMGDLEACYSPFKMNAKSKKLHKK